MLSSGWFGPKSLRLDPAWTRVDARTGLMEVGFPDAQKVDVKEREQLLKRGESVICWIPIDPAHTDKEVQEAIDGHRVGVLGFHYLWLYKQPVAGDFVVEI